MKRYLSFEAYLNHKNMRSNNYDNEILRLINSIQGYAEHVTSTVMEWIGSFLICSYAATFAYEFKDLRLEYEFTTGKTTNTLQSTDSETP